MSGASVRIPFGSVPSMSALFLDYVGDWTRVQRFYSHNYSLESIVAYARERTAAEVANRSKVAPTLTGNSSSIEKLQSGAVAVMTGQQPGLFTGPMYSILKAITAIKLARELEAAGIRAVPVFWVAAEDHDYEEIHWAGVLDRDSALQKVRVDLTNGDGSPVGWLRFKDDVREAIAQSLSGLPQSEFMEDVRRILESCYQPQFSPVDAFIKMMAALFQHTPLVLANPLHPDLKQLAMPMLRQAVKQNAEIRAAVLARSRALSEAGYHEQVKVDQNFTGLFAYRERSRQPLRPADVAPDLSLSPNVLLRPVVQDSIFPTVAYVGGPAEVAYWAQAAAVYETLKRPVPPVFPRISATIIEPRVSRPLKKYGMGILDVFRGKDFMKRKAVEAVQSAELFDQVRDRITADLDSLTSTLNLVDPTLVGALDTSKQKMIHQIETLRTKYVNAEAKRTEMLEKHLDSISNSLYPEKKLQERVINVTSFIVRYGLGFVDILERSLDLDSREHQLLEI